MAPLLGLRSTPDGRRLVYQDGRPIGYQVCQGQNVPEFGPGPAFALEPAVPGPAWYGSAREALAALASHLSGS